MAASKPINKVFSYDSWVHAIAGATGSVFAMSTFYPLDTVRYRLQVDDNINQRHLSTVEILRRMIQEEGIASLYCGIIPVLQSLCISNMVYFYTFHSLKALNQTAAAQSAFRDLLCGSLAGIINVLTTTPFWVVNTRLKKSESVPYDNLFEGLAYILKTEGISGLWAGTVPSLMLVSNPALQFMMYEMLKRQLARLKIKPSTLTFFLIGAIAKTFATVMTYPLQVIQTKLRNGRSSAASANVAAGTSNVKNAASQSIIPGIPPKAGVIQMLLYILKANGFAGLFVGLEAKLLQTVLTASLMFVAYEKIARFVTMLLIRRRSK